MKSHVRSHAKISCEILVCELLHLIISSRDVQKYTDGFKITHLQVTNVKDFRKVKNVSLLATPNILEFKNSFMN